MKNVYALRNRKIAVYHDPILAVEDSEQMGKNLSRFCMLEKDTARKNHYDECELYKLGVYDDETGVIKVDEKPVFILDLGQFFEVKN